jgi:16S rRNA (guanine966-N2)-methyltransferase
MFNALWSRGAIDGAEVLDLFAGSGALGIEALSRGAAHATFVDEDPRARRAVERNLAACGFTDRAEVVADRAERFLAREASWRPGPDPAPDPVAGSGSGRHYDLAFCDPPYAFAGWAELLGALPADLVVIEAADEVAVPDGWELVRSARHGGTWVGFAERL